MLPARRQPPMTTRPHCTVAGTCHDVARSAARSSRSGGSASGVSLRWRPHDGPPWRRPARARGTHGQQVWRRLDASSEPRAPPISRTPCERRTARPRDGCRRPGARRRRRQRSAGRLHAQRRGRAGAGGRRRLRHGRRRSSPAQAICTTADADGANVNTDCEATAGPHNETSIAVNPTDANNMIGGANDYQLGLNPGGHVTETVLSRAHVTFDGGTHLVGVSDPLQLDLPGHRRPVGGVRRGRARLLRDARLPLRRAGQRAEPGRPRRQLRRRRQDLGVRPGRRRQRQLRQRRRPARQGVRRGVGQRQRDRHLRRLPARPRRAASSAPASTRR